VCLQKHFTWNMQLSCNKLLTNTHNRILFAITQFIFLQWPYQRVHNAQMLPMLPAKKKHQQDEHSLIWTPRQAYAQDDKKGKRETFKQPLNQWTWLIVSQQITCECGHGLNTSSMHLAHCMFRGKQITTWHHQKCHVCLRLKDWACCMERVMVYLYVKNSITSWSLHDLWGLGLCCRCGGYWLDTRYDGYECH
jgi:hypothetical protein